MTPHHLIPTTPKKIELASHSPLSWDVLFLDEKEKKWTNLISKSLLVM
jgi:hypothetical protein